MGSGSVSLSCWSPILTMGFKGYVYMLGCWLVSAGVRGD